MRSASDKVAVPERKLPASSAVMLLSCSSPLLAKLAAAASTEVKAKPLLLAATLIWLAIVLSYRQQGIDQLAVAAFKSNLQAYIELLLFIMVSMTYLNAMEDMQIRGVGDILGVRQSGKAKDT